jgi:hypothetical protein
MRMVIATMLATLASISIAQTARPQVVAPPFERMSSRDGDVHGVRGAGCVWSDRRDKGHPRDATWLMGMADDRAVVKRDGRYVMLKPMPDAKDMGPFTFDRWTGQGMTLVIEKHGRAAQAGTAYDQPARLALTEAGRTTTYAGTVNCGT